MHIVRTLVLTAAVLPLLSSGAQAGDAIATGNGGTLSLGSNWGSYESYRGASFRWVRNDAEIVLAPGTGEVRVVIACEGGPSLGQATFPLRVLDTAHRQVDHVVCNGAKSPAEMLLPATGARTKYLLHADGGDRVVRGEPRILNFRVFRLDDGRSAAGGGDVLAPLGGLRLGSGWFPVERYKGQTFRWMDGDGHLFAGTGAAGNGTLHLLLEVGPSIGSPSAPLTVRDHRGTVVYRTTLRGRGAVTVPVQLDSGGSEFTLAVTGANKPVPHDRRRLNLRLFAATLQR